MKVKCNVLLRLGAKHPVGFVDKKSFNNQKDYLTVMEQVEKEKKDLNYSKYKCRTK